MIYPTANLKNELLAPSVPAPARTGVALIRRIRAAMGSLVTPRLASGLAVGAMLGVATAAIGESAFNGPHNIDPSSVVGTMISDRDSNQSRCIVTDSIKDDGLSGRLEADTVDGIISLHIELQSSDDVSMIISFEGASCVLEEFAQTNPTQNNLTTTSCAIYLTHRGKNTYHFALKRINEEGAWPFVYLQGQNAAYRRRIAPPGGDGC